MSAKASETAEGSWTFTARRLADTARLAGEVASLLGPGRVLALVGELGSGKTTFVRALTEAWGVAELSDVVSPTYTLCNEYRGARGRILHLDFYRLSDSESARALGLEEHLRDVGALVLVEWADRLPELIPAGAGWLTFTAEGAKTRRIVARGLPKPAQLR